jgi:DNA-binding winged helix-turn-helix (wHTH) protein
VSKDALTRAVWGVDYNPLVHEYGLRVNIHHLRRAIEPVGLSVRFDDVGYRLEARCPFAFLETLASPVVR